MAGIDYSTLYPNIGEAQTRYDQANQGLQTQLAAQPHSLVGALLRLAAGGLNANARDRARSDLTKAEQAAMEDQSQRTVQALSAIFGGGGAPAQAAQPTAAPLDPTQQPPQAPPAPSAAPDEPAPAPGAKLTAAVAAQGMPPVGSTPGLAGGAGFPPPPSGGGPGAPQSLIDAQLKQWGVPSSPPPDLGAMQLPQLPVSAPKGPVNVPSLASSPGMGAAPPPAGLPPQSGGGMGMGMSAQQIMGLARGLPPGSAQGILQAALDAKIKAQFGPQWSLGEGGMINTITGQFTRLPPQHEFSADSQGNVMDKGYGPTGQQLPARPEFAVSPEGFMYDKNHGTISGQFPARPDAAPIQPGTMGFVNKNDPTQQTPVSPNIAQSAGPFYGTSPDAMAIADKVRRGEMTPQQATDALAGKVVPGPNGGQNFVTPGQMTGQSQQAPTQLVKPTISPEMQTALAAADDQRQSDNEALYYLHRALELNKKAASGASAPAEVWASRNLHVLPGVTGQLATDSTEMRNALDKVATASLKGTFVRPSQSEFAALKDMQGALTQSPSERERIIENAISVMNSKIARANERAAEIRGGAYLEPGGMSQASQPIQRRRYDQSGNPVP